MAMGRKSRPDRLLLGVNIRSKSNLWLGFIDVIFLNSIILLNNGNLASGSFKEVLIWQKITETSFELIKNLAGHNSMVFSLVVLPNNNWFVIDIPVPTVSSLDPYIFSFVSRDPNK